MRELSFSAIAALHMVLALVVAPLVAGILPAKSDSSRGLWLGGGVFMALLWICYLPAMQQAAAASGQLRAALISVLFGAAVLLWRALLHRPPMRAFAGFLVSGLTVLQISLLGARLVLANHPLYALTSLQDQRLGGMFLWIPGMVVFLWMALRSLAQTVTSLRQSGLLH